MKLTKNSYLFVILYIEQKLFRKEIHIMALTYVINGKIVLPDSVVCDKYLAFDEESGKICGLVDKLPANASVIDAKGNYIAPGLVDIHIHGYLGEDTSDAKPDGIRKMAYGVAQTVLRLFFPQL